LFTDELRSVTAKNKLDFNLISDVSVPL